MQEKVSRILRKTAQVFSGGGQDDAGVTVSATSTAHVTYAASAASRKAPHPFWIIVRKEMSDIMLSWRYVILLALMLLTCGASLYTAITSIKTAVPTGEAVDSFLFLRLFTVSDGTIPSFITFVSFLGPLIGIALGFDAVNSERNKGTLSRMMAQPIHRDYVINAKFVAGISVIGLLFFALGLLIMGLGLLTLGIPPTFDEFLRMIFFLMLSVVYIAFWLNLSIAFSVRFRQPATSALSCIALWIFFSVFYTMIIEMIAKGIAPVNPTHMDQLVSYQQTVQFLLRLSPGHLFNEATMTLLMPEIRTLSLFVPPEQTYGALPSPLSVGQSLLLVWPQLTGLIAAVLVCFMAAYMMFMRQEIRSR
ncbi:ABC transporter permease [Paenibacillus assamensis]|uniref:ABC transporter permease n=1 Tax=Paenibacillus assamensis TaxID=311244 RepID=UPI000425F7A9|nr:ABC transporter permease subunit [Paenibacillus assamensis]